MNIVQGISFILSCFSSLIEMGDFDVISLSSDSSRPSSPFFNISDVLNNSKKPGSSDIPNTVLIQNNINIPEHEKPSPTKSRIIHDLSSSEESEVECTSANPKLSSDEINRLLYKYSKITDERDRTNEQDRTKNIPTFTEQPCSSFHFIPLKTKGNNRKQTLKTHILSEADVKTTKEQRLEERRKKQQEKEKKKAEKQAAKELLNQMKPGNCIKYMTLILDTSLVTSSFGGSLISAIQNSEAKYELSFNNIPHSIFWKRELPGPTVKEENDLVVIWQWEFVIPAIKNRTLCSQIKEIQGQYPGKTIYLIIYGLNAYFSYLKSRRKNNSGDAPKAKKRRSREKEDIPFVTRKEIEEELIELQIMANCNHRLIESSEDLGLTVAQITKAIAETPFKLDKQRRELESLEWFAVGDSRDCVTVDKAGNGLLRLWQQQLCQFNLAGHDVAQSIAAFYPGPQALVKAYDKCNSQKEAEELLKDIPVRRCQGPLTSCRRIGPELSKKIYTFFCSTDGDAPLSQDQ